MPTTRPRVSFNEAGVCNACINAKEKQTIDWSERRQQFLDYLNMFRRPDNPYDCLVPWSGGKDSSAIALRLKEEFNLNPLLVTFSPLIPNEVGNHNREQLIKAGFDNLFIRPNQKVAIHLARRFFHERGNPKAAWDAGVTAATLQTAVKYDIPLIFFAEHGESEYGGRVLSEAHKRERDIAEFLEHLVGDDPINWVDEVVEEKDLAQYIYPDASEIKRVGVKALYFGYFFKWDVYANYKYVRDRIDFRFAPNGRTDGTFTNYDSLDDKIDNIYYYMQLVKFGFGRAVRDASRLIQLGYMSREKALEKVRMYDAEYPKTGFEDSLNYLGLTKSRFDEVVDLHRNSEIWTKTNYKWKLQFEIK